MAKGQVSDFPDQELDSGADSGSEEIETPRKTSARKKISNYESQRMKRIEENKARMEALGLKNMANSFVSSLPKQAKKTSDRKGKGKRKAEDDEEEYRPSEEEELDSSSEEDEDDDDDDEEFTLAWTRKKKTIQTPKKQVSSRSDLDFAFDDDLLQAIALSLQDSSQSSSTHPIERMRRVGEGNSQSHEDLGKRKKKKLINSRVQMTEDELVIHFFQFDEAGKGNINLRDLQKVAAAHDFTWSEKEIADMVLYFDTDGDGKLSLEDFRKIAARCNMIQGSETTLTGQA